LYFFQNIFSKTYLISRIKAAMGRHGYSRMRIFKDKEWSGVRKKGKADDVADYGF
jgi:hypothetical protein